MEVGDQEPAQGRGEGEIGIGSQGSLYQTWDVTVCSHGLGFFELGRYFRARFEILPGGPGRTDKNDFRPKIGRKKIPGIDGPNIEILISSNHEDTLI